MLLESFPSKVSLQWEHFLPNAGKNSAECKYRNIYAKVERHLGQMSTVVSPIETLENGNRSRNAAENGYKLV